MRSEVSAYDTQTQEHPDLTTRRIVRSSERGMSLVEIMVVVVIIGLIAGVVSVQVFGQLSKAQESTARTQIKQISDALDLYRLDFGRHPNTGEGLGALVSPAGNKRPYLPSLPRDPWGGEYVYIEPGTHNSAGFDLMSYGVDGVQGGGDDIGNWDNQTE